jgi:hypothetical protein
MPIEAFSSWSLENDLLRDKMLDRKMEIQRTPGISIFMFPVLISNEN